MPLDTSRSTMATSAPVSPRTSRWHSTPCGRPRASDSRKHSELPNAAPLPHGEHEVSASTDAGMKVPSPEEADADAITMPSCIVLSSIAGCTQKVESSPPREEHTSPGRMRASASLASADTCAPLMRWNERPYRYPARAKLPYRCALSCGTQVLPRRVASR